jgi:hypothetical protein
MMVLQDVPLTLVPPGDMQGLLMRLSEPHWSSGSLEERVSRHDTLILVCVHVQGQMRASGIGAIGRLTTTQTTSDATDVLGSIYDAVRDIVWPGINIASK